MTSGQAERLLDAGRRSIGWLPRRRLGYWLAAAVILALSTWATPFIDAHLNFTAERGWLFQRLTHSPTNPTAAGQARLVIIKDDEYWLGDLHHRKPTDRRYLASIVRALKTAGASVIALDFDLRTPLPAKNVQPGDYGAVDTYEPYRAETDELIGAIDDVAQERKIVLAKTITGPDNGPFQLRSDAYQPYGICTKLIGDGAWANPGAAQFPLIGAASRNISCGYIALMDDARQIPPPARIVGQTARLDSFALAIVRARNRAAVPDLAGRPYFGAYIESDVAGDPNITVSARDLLRDPVKARDVLLGWPVVVGAGWHERGFGSPPMIDIHPTPIGAVSGPLIHENLVEAVLSRRIYPGLDGAGLTVMEVLTGALAAVFFAAFASFGRKLAAIVGAIAILFALQWLILRLFGAFFDAFVPVFALGLHALFDRLVGEHDAEYASPLDCFVDWVRHARLPLLAKGAARASSSPPPADKGGHD